MWSDMAEFIRKRNDWENDKRSTSELAAADPVSSATYLNLKFKAVLAYIRSSANPIGEVLHYCYSVESQGRGMRASLALQDLGEKCPHLWDITQSRSCRLHFEIHYMPNTKQKSFTGAVQACYELATT